MLVVQDNKNTLILDENTQPNEFIRHFANSITEVDVNFPDQAIRTKSGDIIVPTRQTATGNGAGYIAVASDVHTGSAENIRLTDYQYA